jgi:AraC-like DNA-binding protein
MPSDRHIRIWSAIERLAADPRLGAGSIGELCQITGASARSVYDISRAFSGLSPSAYIKQQRLQLALDMLRRALLSIVK